MINPEKRKAIYYLYTQGLSLRKISDQLQVDRRTVKRIIDQKGAMPNSIRSDKILLDNELIRRLFNECDGYVQRMHEKLDEEHDLNIGYSTLTRKIRELGLGKSQKQRCDQVPDEPGWEMQHDTTVYKVKLAGKIFKLTASLIYLRYSKLRYLKFYRYFNRFKIKCFFHESLTSWGYSASICVIDNTNLARLRGRGKSAIIVPEMEQFARQYGFEFICHEIGHANRKAGNERSFYTVETNFFPGRKFESLEDLNRQAYDWATNKMAHRPVAKTGLIPAKAFEYEQSYLNKLPPYITPPYLEFQRLIDQYGYVSFDGNYYWVPGSKRHEVKVLQFPDGIKIYHYREMLIQYQLPPHDVKNEKFSPPGQPKPRYQPNNRKNPTNYEKEILGRASETSADYLKFALKEKTGIKKHNFIRQLYYLHKRLCPDLFDKTLKRALTYRIVDIEIIERIAGILMKEADYQMPHVSIDEQFISRPSYIEGRFTDDVDLSIYKNEYGEDENG